MKTVLVIPTYNERENIELLIWSIRTVSATYNLNLIILIVDDNSPDGTASVVEELKETNLHGYPDIMLLKRPMKTGLGSAYKHGFESAFLFNPEIIIEMDADNSHNPQYIPRMIEQIKGGCDVVIGSRKVYGGKVIGWTRYRHIVSNIANFLARIIIGLPILDSTSGYRAYRASCLRRIDLGKLSTHGYAFQIEILNALTKRKCVYTEIPITFVDRIAGKSKLKMKDIVEFAALVMRLGLKRLKSS